jgi:hypothetical protein
MTALDGVIYYTTDGSDPRQKVSGAVNPQARVYETPLLITTTTQFRARALKGDTWSALNEITFEVETPEPTLSITEIMYNPPDGGDYEFIELKNTGGGQFDLSNMSFEGIIYIFPPGTLLEAGEMIVLVRNPTAFARRYPGVGIDGVYDGQLSNKGEQVALKDADGRTIVSVKYDDENGWPLSPDGRADSLVVVDPDSDLNDPNNWRASANPYGSPGADEPM